MQHTVRKAEAGQICARALANVAYGAARSGRDELLGLLFRVVARAAAQQVCKFNARDLHFPLVVYGP